MSPMCGYRVQAIQTAMFDHVSPMCGFHLQHSEDRLRGELDETIRVVASICRAKNQLSRLKRTNSSRSQKSKVIAGGSRLQSSSSIIRKRQCTGRGVGGWTGMVASQGWKMKGGSRFRVAVDGARRG